MVECIPGYRQWWTCEQTGSVVITACLNASQRNRVGAQTNRLSTRASVYCIEDWICYYKMKRNTLIYSWQRLPCSHAQFFGWPTYQIMLTLLFQLLSFRIRCTQQKKTSGLTQLCSLSVTPVIFHTGFLKEWSTASSSIYGQYTNSYFLGCIVCNITFTQHSRAIYILYTDNVFQLAKWPQTADHCPDITLPTRTCSLCCSVKSHTVCTWDVPVGFTCGWP